MKLKRKKVGDRNYNLVDAVTGEIIANAVQTGEHGRDNYPWEWSLNTGWIFGRLDASTGRSEDSMRNCVDYIESHGEEYGFLKPAGEVSPETIRQGQVFRTSTGSGYFYYIATEQASVDGPFTVIPAINSKSEVVEVKLLPGDRVTLYVEI